MIKIAVMGFGVVGSGVVEVINKNSDSISVKAGEKIEIKYILDIRDFPESPYKHLITRNVDDILNDDEINIVVEVMGGLNPAYEYTKKALLSGKHVVTSNKELVAAYGSELLKIAKDKNINYLFEASVGGGIPIIRPLNQCLAANKITEIAGILNGTTNYILTQMIKYGQSFEDALKDAQQKGYAERNPEADIEGYDTCRKIAILSSLAFGSQIDYNKIPTEGITKIDLYDVEYAENMYSVIKLLAYAKKVENKVFALVAPVMISKDHPLANVENVFNSILLKGDAIGDVMFYGRGAGKLPTASAVVADIIDIVKNIDRNNRYFWKEEKENIMVDYGEMAGKFFVRIKTKNKSKIINAINEMMGDCSFISSDNKALQDEIALLTPKIKEKVFRNTIKAIENMPEIDSIHRIIRVDDE